MAIVVVLRRVTVDSIQFVLYYQTTTNIITSTYCFPFLNYQR
jgi:hypothetical protein